MATTRGQKASARAHARPLETERPIATGTAPVLHVFVAMESFAVFWRGCTLTYLAGQRYTAEAGLKAALQLTDKDIVWES